MFAHIKKQILAIQEANEITRNQIDDAKECEENDLITECAHLFQELDDITVEGEEINQYRDIDALNISLEDDPELDSFEISMSDGRILDLPGDILVHSESYEPMKSLEDFDNNEDMYTEYLSNIYQEGVFSAEKIDIKDPSIIWSKMVDFGPSDPNNESSSPYVVRMNIGYEKLAFNKILLKQKDSIQMIVENNSDVFKSFGKRYIDLLEKHGYKIPDEMCVWDIVTPNLIMVPIEPIDSFSIVIRSENKLAKAGDDKYIYIAISLAISAAKQNSSKITDVIDLDKKPQFASNIIDSVGLLKESMKPTPVIGRTILEGIDFGPEPPSIDGDGDTSSSDNADSGENGSTDDTSNEGDAVQTDANDVSKEIAQNVANANTDNDTDKDADKGDETSADDSAVTGDGLDTANTDMPEDDTETSDENNASDEIPADVAGGDLTDTGDVDSQLADLDATGNTDAELDDTSNIGDMDVENMSPNELVQAAAEKIKSMSISDIKQFLSSDDGTVATESFILTKKNINAELDAALRKCMGDLNNQKIPMSGIHREFKKDGKKLNKVLSKASKMTDVYNESEIKALTTFNKCLADVLIAWSDNMSESNKTTFKQLLKLFVSQSKRVGAIIEKHKNDTFQESEEPELDKFGLPIRNI